MAKMRTTVTLDPKVMRAVKVRAARTGKRESQVIEEAVREHLHVDWLEDVWERNRQDPLSEEEAMELAREAQRWARSQPH